MSFFERVSLVKAAVPAGLDIGKAAAVPSGRNPVFAIIFRSLAKEGRAGGRRLRLVRNPTIPRQWRIPWARGQEGRRSANGGEAGGCAPPDPAGYLSQNERRAWRGPTAGARGAGPDGGSRGARASVLGGGWRVRRGPSRARGDGRRARPGKARAAAVQAAGAPRVFNSSTTASSGRSMRSMASSSRNSRSMRVSGPSITATCPCPERFAIWRA